MIIKVNVVFLANIKHMPFIKYSLPSPVPSTKMSPLARTNPSIFFGSSGMVTEADFKETVAVFEE